MMTWGGFAGSQEPGSAQICKAGCFGSPNAQGILQNSSRGWARWACPHWPRSRLPVVGSARGSLWALSSVVRPSCRPCRLAWASSSWIVCCLPSAPGCPHQATVGQGLG